MGVGLWPGTGMILRAAESPPAPVSGSNAEARELVDRVRQALQARLGAVANEIQVERNQDGIFLTGTVAILPEKEMATEAAGSVPGVQQVINAIRVTAEARSDQEVARDVSWALRADPATFGLDIDVTAADGVVTLRGAVETVPQRRIAEWVVSAIRGVREVKNELTVAVDERSDQEIHDQLVQGFANSPSLSDDEIKVQVDYGVVTLSGRVDSALEMNWARGDAWVPGVRRVNANALEVRHTPALTSDEAAEALPDGAIRQAIVDAFIYDPRIGSVTTHVSVEEGVATLEGVVSTRQAAQAAVQIARNTGGIIKVIDRLQVRAEQPRSDQQVAGDLRTSIGSAAALAGDEVKVEVAEGRARLTGVVDSYYEKWVAGNLADRTRGVIDVENALAIEGISGQERQAGYYYFPDGSMYSPWIYAQRASDRPATDAQLAAEVKRELSLSPFADADDIEVTVSDGVVTLDGEVGSWPERGAAIDNAYQAGAASVVDNLRVAASD